MVDAKTDAIDRIVKKRDWLAVERLRLFRLQRAIDAYARRIDSELQECVEAGRVLGVKINLPIWENVWTTSLEKEMARVCAVSEWTRPEQAMQKSEYATLGFDDVLTFRIADTLKDCDRQEFRVRQDSWRPRRPTLRHLVLERLRSAGRKGSKAAPIRAHAKQFLERDFHVKAVGMTLNRLAKEGLARRKGHVWFPVGQAYEREEGLEEDL